MVGKNSLYTGIRTMAHLKFKEFEMYKTSDWETEQLKEQAIENRFGINDSSIDRVSSGLVLPRFF